MQLVENILLLIPQRHPFVMVDELLYFDETVTRTGFRVRESNIFVERGNFNEAGLLENMAQTAASGAGYTSCIQNRPVGVGYIGAVKNFEVLDLPRVNDELITEIVVMQKIFDATIVAGSIAVNKKVIARCEMKIFARRN